MNTIFDSDYILTILIVFSFFTFALWPLFYLLRVLFLKVLPSRFSYWPVVLWALPPFLLIWFNGSVPVLLCLPFLAVCGIAGYILEKSSVYLLNRKMSGNYTGRDIGVLHFRRSNSSHTSSKSSSLPSSRTGRSDFGGGKFSGGGGSGSW